MRAARPVEDRGERGMTLVEVLIAMSILAVGLLAVLGALGVGALTVQNGGNQSKATAYARQQIESLLNVPFTAGPLTGNDTPETGVARNWRIAPVGAGVTPNRLARITVSVQVNQTEGPAAQSITLETMRAECGGAAPPC